MNSFIYYVVAASACPNGNCPQTAAAAVPVQPAPVVIYQAAPRPLLPWLAPKTQVFIVR